MAGLPAAALAAQSPRRGRKLPPVPSRFGSPGTVKGAYTFVVNSETDATFQMKGSGTVAGLGGVKVGAQLTRTDVRHVPVVLSNRRGSITLRLDSPRGDLTTQAAGAQPARLLHTITSGTGAVPAAAQGQGTADVMLVPQLASLGLSGRFEPDLASRPPLSRSSADFFLASALPIRHTWRVR